MKMPSMKEKQDGMGWIVNGGGFLFAAAELAFEGEELTDAFRQIMSLQWRMVDALGLPKISDLPFDERVAEFVAIAEEYQKNR